MRYSQISFPDNITNLLPPFLRKNRHKSWLFALLAPLVSLYEDTLYKMQHDGRVIYLEKVLNEKAKVPGYNPNEHEATKKIRIGGYDEVKKEWLYIEPEKKPAYEPITLYTETEINNDRSGTGFTVHVLAAFSSKKSIIRQAVEYYKLAGKTFQIKIA